MKRKKQHKRGRKKVIANQFTMRDAWDVLVIIMLLSVIVYCTNYVRNHNSDLLLWPQIKQVNVNGYMQNLNQNEIKNIIRMHIRGGFFRVSMSKLEQEIINLPWVYHASAQRFWPSTISIKIYEQKPIARWGESGLMNAYGDLFFPESIGSYTSLVMLYGEESRAKELASVFENSLIQLKPYGLQLHGLFEDERQSKHLVLSNGMVIAIGDGDANKKIARFTAAYEQYLSPHITDVKKIDLRYTNGLAVEWKNPQLANNLVLERNL